MKRELSVEDLFAPLNRLDVCNPLPSSKMVSHTDPRVADARPVGITPIDAVLRSSCASVDLDRAAEVQAASIAVPETARIPTEGTDKHSDMSLSCSIKGFGSEDASSPFLGTASTTSSYTSTPKATTASVNDSGVVQIHLNSTSDEEHQIVDDRRQRRMLSNRESARRSRLRKQQHLDELRGHVAQLQAQNSQMLNSFNLASQQFAQVTEENRKLRSEAMGLSHQLQRLHHSLASQRASSGLKHGAYSVQAVESPQH